MSRALRPARAADLPAVLALLRQDGLPMDGVEEWFGDFIVADDGGIVVAAAGLERYGDAALLRSVVVAASRRGRGLGSEVVDHVLRAAARHGIRLVFLLTGTAEDFFTRHGFARVPRDEVPAAVRESVEFRDACPASATVMRRALTS